MKRSFEQALIHLQKDFNALLQAVPVGIIILSSNLQLQQINKAALQLLDLQGPPTQFQGVSLFELIGKNQLSESELRNSFKTWNIVAGKNRKSLSVTRSPSDSENLLLIIGPLKEVSYRQNQETSGGAAYYHFDDIIGNSACLLHAIDMAKIAAKNDPSVLLTGESGTGKELFAQSIHSSSSRCNGPFVPVNCGALPRTLIESELFGYVSGSFTGAKRGGQAGKFEQANGGTLFLDEIGEMPLSAQVALLRALQSKEIFRIGSEKSIKVDVRIIAANNIPLSSLVKEKRFRQDLFYRLDVFCILLPSLRERAGDLPILLNHFLHKYQAKRTDVIIKGFSPEAIHTMEAYPWPGNIRELQNAVERAVYMTQTEYIGDDALPAAIRNFQAPCDREEAPFSSSALPHVGHISLSEMEKQQIENALHLCHWNVKDAADMLKINRRTLYRRLEKYGIRRQETRD